MQEEEKAEQLDVMPPATGEILDLISKDHSYYMATLAPKIWFTKEERAPLYKWFSRHDQVLGYTEVASRKHLHVLFSSDVKKTGNVTRSLEQLFDKHKIEFEKGITINVKKASHPLGYFHYLTSDVKGGTRVLLKGWRQTWIQEQCRNNLKQIPRKLLKKDVYVVNNVEGPDLITLFAERHHMPLVDKRTFIAVVVEMECNKYRFHSCKKKDLLTNTLALHGHIRCSVSLWESELCFIGD